MGLREQGEEKDGRVTRTQLQKFTLHAAFSPGHFLPRDIRQCPFWVVLLASTEHTSTQARAPPAKTRPALRDVSSPEAENPYAKLRWELRFTETWMPLFPHPCTLHPKLWGKQGGHPYSPEAAEEAEVWDQKSGTNPRSLSLESRLWAPAACSSESLVEPGGHSKVLLQPNGRVNMCCPQGMGLPLKGVVGRSPFLAVMIGGNWWKTIQVSVT